MSDLFTRPQLKAGSLRRGLSPTLWNQAPLAQISIGGLDQGFGFVDDFLSYDDDSYRWNLSQDGSSGTGVMDPAAKGGVLLLDSASTSTGLGPDLQAGGAIPASSFIASASSKIYFEARIKLADIAGPKIGAFVGLAAVLSPLIDSGANASPNHVGFETFDSLTLSFATEKAGTRSVDTSAGTIVDGTYVKLGFVIDGLDKVTPFVNGVAGTVITTGSTNLPIVGMTPSLCVRSLGTTDPIMHIDWVACFQEENIDN